MERDPANSHSEFELSAAAIPWQDMVRSIYRHRKIVLSIVAIGVSLSTVRALTLPPTYKARSVLMVKDSRAHVAVTPDAETKTVLHRVGDAQVNALATLLQDANLVRDALARVRAQNSPIDEETGEPVEIPNERGLNPLALPGSMYRKAHQVPIPSELEQRAQTLAQLVEVTPVAKTSLIELSFTSGDPVWAAAFINGLSETLIDKYRRIYESSTTQEFFHSQRLVLADKLEKAQAARTAFRDRVGSDLLTLNTEELRLRIAELSNLLDAAETERAEQSAKAEAVVDLNSNPALGAVKARIIELELERSELLSRYTKTSVAVRDLDRQIAEAKRLLAKEREATLAIQRGAVQNALDSVDARISAITTQISDNRSKLRELEKVAPEWERLENEVASAKEAYQTYSRKEEQARFSNALDESKIVNVAIVEPATPPTKPESSPIKRLLVLGLAASTLLGVGFALVRDWLDPSVKTTAQVERMTGLPVLGEIQT